jgi:hypothetical protein
MTLTLAGSWGHLLAVSWHIMAKLLYPCAHGQTALPVFALPTAVYNPSPGPPFALLNINYIPDAMSSSNYSLVLTVTPRPFPGTHS